MKDVNLQVKDEKRELGIPGRQTLVYFFTDIYFGFMFAYRSFVYIEYVNLANKGKRKRKRGEPGR